MRPPHTRRPPLRALIPLLLVLWTLLPALAQATTLAVLPLEKGAAGEAYDGLGSALAGMIVSDLASAEGLTLVERERLDALLAEIDLGDSGFVDPKTAARLGKGAGAEVVLLGSYSVVASTLALDARLVEVQTGRVLQGATAQGPINDFVSVEKELVEALLSSLDATLDSRSRRTFYSNVPTEDWDAFTAWSRAQARASDGELEAARKAFQEALAKDPAFTQAAEGLARLQGLIATTRAADRQTRATRYDAVEQAVLAAVPDVRTRKAKDPWTLDELTGMAVRFTVLHNQQRHCDRYAEMLHYLDLVAWDPKPHEEGLTPQSAFGYSFGKQAEAMGVERWSKDVPHPDEAVYESPATREGSLWRSTRDFVFDDLDNLRDKTDAGLLTSLLACFPEPARPRELERVRKALIRHGHDGRPNDTELSNLELITAVAAWSDAQDGRLRPETDQALAALVARYPDPDSSLHRRALRVAEDVARRANQRDHYNAGLLGLTESEIRRYLEAIERGEAPFTRDQVAWCGPGWDKTFRERAARIRQDWDEEVADNDPYMHELHWGARLARVVGGLGCLDDVQPRYPTWEAVVAAVRIAPARKHPTHFDERTCPMFLNNLQTVASSPVNDSVRGIMSYQTVDLMYTMVQQRCLVENP